MQSGQFKYSIEIYRIEEIDIGLGFIDRKKITVCKDRAAVYHIKSNETMRNDVATYAQRKKIAIRRRNIEIDTDCFVELENAEYNIIDMDPYSDNLLTFIYIEKVVK